MDYYSVVYNNKNSFELFCVLLYFNFKSKDRESAKISSNDTWLLVCFVILTCDCTYQPEA